MPGCDEEGLRYFDGFDFNASRVPILTLPTFDAHRTQRNEAYGPVSLADPDSIADLQKAACYCQTSPHCPLGQQNPYDRYASTVLHNGGIDPVLAQKGHIKRWAWYCWIHNFWNNAFNCTARRVKTLWVRLVCIRYVSVILSPSIPNNG